MYDDGYPFEGVRRDNSNPFFPLRAKHVREPGFDGHAEPDEKYVHGLISGEVELIARTSYLLGHAEERSFQVEGIANSQRQRADKLAEKLDTVQSDRDYKERRLEERIRTIDELRAELKLKDKKIKRLSPKKSVTKKGK